MPSAHALVLQIFIVLLLLPTRAQAEQAADGCALDPPCDVCNYDDVDLGNLATTPDFPVLRRRWDCRNVLCRLLRERPGGRPPRQPPAELLPLYTMRGAMPVVLRYAYHPAEKFTVTRWSRENIDSSISKVREGQLKGTYGHAATSYVYQAVGNHSDEIRGKRCLVIGSQRPWLESILLAHGASHVTTLEYATVRCDHPKVTTRTPPELAAAFLQGREEPFDVMVTYSSIEHSGLGRYGDRLNPFGDLEAMAQAHCMLRPGGLALLNVPFHRGHGQVEYTLHRLYSWERVRLLTANYRILHQYYFRGFVGREAKVLTEWLSTIFVLRRL